MHRAILFGAALLFGLSAPLQAQFELSPGSRVQFVWPANGAKERVTASVVDSHAEGFSFRLEESGTPSAYRSALSATQSIRYEDVGFMRVSQGHSRARSAFRGSLWGVYVAGSLGAIAGPIAAHSMGHGIGTASAILGLSSAAVGATVGGVIGAIVSPERWKSYRFVVPK